MEASTKQADHGIVPGIMDKPFTSAAALASAGIQQVQDLSGLSVADLEKKIVGKKHKKPRPSGSLTSRAPQTARAILEVNMKLIAEKQERKALARQASKEEFEKLLTMDRMSIEGEKAFQITKRRQQRELAEHYKETIDDIEKARAEGKRKPEQEIDFFPFVEGEMIDQSRKAKSANMRKEMLSFLVQQREAQPAREDRILQDVRGKVLAYPVDPVFTSRSSANNREDAAKTPRVAGAPNCATADEPRVTSSRHEPITCGDPGDVDHTVAGKSPAEHFSKHPCFLSRATHHLSRRLRDDHVRKALEENVHRTKNDLEARLREKQEERRQQAAANLVDDAERSDKHQELAIERMRNREGLERQIEEKKRKARQAKEAWQAEKPGYWGPEEKEAVCRSVNLEHKSDLRKQIEVDQARKQLCNSQRCHEERLLVNNGMAEMAQDRDKDQAKRMKHREVLVKTWDSQRKIKQVRQELEKPR